MSSKTRRSLAQTSRLSSMDCSPNSSVCFDYIFLYSIAYPRQQIRSDRGRSCSWRGRTHRSRLRWSSRTSTVYLTRLLLVRTIIYRTLSSYAYELRQWQLSTDGATTRAPKSLLPFLRQRAVHTAQAEHLPVSSFRENLSHWHNWSFRFRHLKSRDFRFHCKHEPGVNLYLYCR